MNKMTNTGITAVSSAVTVLRNQMGMTPNGTGGAEMSEKLVRLVTASESSLNK